MRATFFVMSGREPATEDDRVAWRVVPSVAPGGGGLVLEGAW